MAQGEPRAREQRRRHFDRREGSSPPPNDRGSDGIVLSPSFAKDDVHGRATATRVTEEERDETDGAGGEDKGRTGEDGWR